MKLARAMGVTLMILGAIGFLFFSILLLISAVDLKYEISTTGQSILPSELNDLITKLYSKNLSDMDGSLKIWGVILLNGMPATSGINEARDFMFALAIAFTVMSLAIFLASITSIFSPLSLGFVFVFVFLIIAAALVGAIFPNYDDFTVIETDSLIGASTLFSPLFAIFVGSFFQMGYFGARKRHYRNK